MSKRLQGQQIQTFCSAATCQCRQRSPSSSKLYSCIATRPPADAGSYRARCPPDTENHRFKHFVTRPPASTDSYRVRPTSCIPTPSHGHLLMQAATTLDVQEPPRSVNSNIFLRGHLQMQTAIACNQQALFLHSNAATCPCKQLSR